MDPLTGKETIIAILGSGGLIGGLVTFLSFVSGRVDAYRARKRDKQKETDERRNLVAAAADGDQDRLVANLWKMIDTLESAKKRLEEEIDTMEEDDKLSRPRVTKLYRTIYAMRIKLDSVASLVTVDETLSARWHEIHQLCDELDDILSVVDTHISEAPSH